MEVIWAHEAEQQLMAIADYYLRTVDRSEAERVVKRIVDAGARLAESPHIGKFLVKRGQAYREVVVHPFIKLIYRAVSNKVMVIAVWDCRRDGAEQ